MVRLYNLNKDPEELEDIASDPKNREKIILLFTDLMQLQKEMGDEFNLLPIYEKLS